MKNKFFNRLFLLSTALITMSVNVWSADVTASVNIGTLVSQKGYEVSSGNTVNTKCTSIDLDDNINLSLNSSGNNGSFWGTTPIDWRAYQNQNATFTLTAKNGATLKSVTFTFSVSNNGTLNTTGTGSSISTGKLTSNTALSLTGTSQTFYVGSTNTETKGQVRITAISVTYTAGSSKADVTLTPTQNARNVTVDDIVEDLSTWYTISPVAYDGTITYTSSDEEVFAEDEGAGYAFSTGTCNLYINASETSNYKAANCTISVTVSAPAEQCTVTFLNNGQLVTSIGTNGVKTYNKGDALGTLPTQGDMTPCDDTSIHFMGWYAGDAITTKKEKAPTMVTPTTTVNDNMILRAVWAREQ